MIMSVKNAQAMLITRTLAAFGAISVPWCMSEASVYQMQFTIVNWFSSRFEPGLHGCGLCHSYGLNRATMNSIKATTILKYYISSYSKPKRYPSPKK
jgi:hypothetical protein